MRRPSLFSIAPDAPFLATLCDRVLDGTLLGDWRRESPFWLSDVTIILPTRRARLTLAEHFARRLGGAALLPDIRTFGGETPDEEPFLPPFDAPVSLVAVKPLERMLTLARLVDAWAHTVDGQKVLATPPNAAEILGLAQSLGTVIDDLTIEGGSLTPLNDDIGKLDLAANWQQTKAFLDIAMGAWPVLLASQGKADAAVLRNDRLRRQASAAPRLYGDRPVIAAGSTGSVPATAELLAAIAALPRGALVLPGLDTTLSGVEHDQVLNPLNAPHGHPQYVLARLLRRLGTVPAEVVELSGGRGTQRLALMRTALALADATEAWAASRETLDSTLSLAMSGVSLIAARTVDDEARAIAIAAREALSAGRTVGIVSPDQTLSRRVAAELLRFDIAVDDAAGTPLFQSPAGRMARLVLAVAVSAFAPVDLMALLHNQATRLGLARPEVARLAQLVDLGLLRGQRPATGVAGLRAALAANVENRTKRPARVLSQAEGAAVGELLDRLAIALQPLCELVGRPQLHAAEFSMALAEAVGAATAGDGASTVPGMPQFAAWATELSAQTGDGPAFAPVTLDAVLAALMAGVKVTSPPPRRDDIAIWGRLEARLQNPDVLILAGLNEDIWPEPADPGPWLSRGMRLAAGLEPPERQQGQAAHDFEMAMGNEEVILAFAERRGTSPALPSRLVQRLEAFLGKTHAEALRARGRKWVEMARRLDAVAGEPRPATRPVPKPPADKRPRQLSITEIETLFRSPYDLYARHVLKLRPLAALGEMPDARERGSMIHDVFARFVIEGHDFAAPGAAATLMAMAETAFAGLDAIGERRDIWLRRFALAAEQFLAFERGRAVSRRHAEIDGKWLLPLGFALTGRADRIDELADGTLEIIDFKTGSIPSSKAMKQFEAPQLLLEAKMAEVGAFTMVAPASSSALTYIKIGLGPEAFVLNPFKPRDDLDVMGAANEVSQRLQGHVEALLLRDDRPMAARIRPDVTRRYRGEYDHLARTDEWTLAAGDDE